MKAETELKLALSPAEARALLKAEKLQGFQIGRAKRRQLHSTYFDSPRFRLRRADMSLRVRDDGKRRIQTIKARCAGPPGLQNYQEWTLPIESARDGYKFVPHPDTAFTLACLRNPKRLRPIFTTHIERTTVLMKTDRAVVEMAVDEGSIEAQRKNTTKRLPICEVEFELLSGDPGDLLDLALTVCENFKAQPVHQTKAQRGYALIDAALRPKPCKASSLALQNKMAVADAFLTIVADVLDHLFANQEPTLQGHPEGIHQTRVAMRRLRAALNAFKSILGYEERTAFNGEFRWFQQCLAPARDWQVFLTETLPLISASGMASGRQIKQLKRIARRERRHATQMAVSHLQSRRYTRLILHFQKWAADLRNTLPATTLNQEIKPFARQVLQRTQHDLLQETRPLRRLTADERHETRKRGKKTRYAMEFFSALWTGDNIKPYLKLMERLQNELGDANDAGVAGKILWTLQTSAQDQELAMLVHAWSQQQEHDRVRGAQRHWRRFRKAEPFW